MMDSVFEVKNINKQGFELYNLVNEKAYTVKSQIKMVNYRRVFKGSYLVCKLIVIDGEYFLSNIERVISESDNLSAYKAAVAIQMETPSMLYEDNEEKLSEIKKNVEFLGQKYKEFFKTEEVLTSNTKLNGLLDLFNEYVDGGERTDYDKYIESPKKADVIVQFDSEYGLMTIPKGKQNASDKKEFSVPTILYSSRAFEKFMELSGTPRPTKQNREAKIGRNDPCACGSGKKYKKCCLC